MFSFHSQLCDCVSGCLQAKTTKKIVLRLQCQACKTTHMHAIKVSGCVGASCCTLKGMLPQCGRGRGRSKACEPGAVGKASARIGRVAV